MSRDASGDLRLPHVDNLQPDVGTFMIARLFAEVYRDVLEEPLPESLAAILRRLEIQEAERADRGSDLHVVMVVEGDPEVRDLAVALLEETDLDVVEIASAEDALAYLQEHGEDVAMIFADIRLAGKMDGMHLAKAACTLWPTVRIVLTSGSAGNRPEELPDGVTFMTKPWRGLDVLVEAEKAVRQPQLPVT